MGQLDAPAADSFAAAFDRDRDRPPMALAARALASIAGVGASLELFLQSVLVPQRIIESFLRANWLSNEDRLAFTRAVLGGGGGALLLGLIYLAVTRAEGVPRLQWFARATRPLLVLALVPTLLTYNFASGTTLTYLVALVLFTIALEWALRDGFSAWTSPWNVRAWTWPEGRGWAFVASWAPAAVVGAGALFYAIYFSHYTLLNHHRLGTSAFDLGIHVNWSYNALHGNPWRCPTFLGPDGGYFVGAHAIFAMFGWLPLYAIHPGSEVLLIYQACIVGGAAIPLYLFGKTQLPRWSAAVVAVLFLFYAPVHGPNFYDYHELMPLPFWTFWLLWAIATRRNWLVPVFVVILYAHREDVAVGLAVLGTFLLLSGARPRLGAILAVVSVAWFITIKFVIMQRLYHTWFADIYKDLRAPGDTGYASIVQTVLINPSYFVKTLLTEQKVIYFFHIFLPVAFLPLRRATLLLLAIPGFFFTLMTTGYPATLSISFQYTMHWVPYVLAATVLALRGIGQVRDGVAEAGEPGGRARAIGAGIVRRRAALGAAAAAMFFHSYAFGAVFQHHTFIGGFTHIEFKETALEEMRYQALQRMIALIPQSASVAASENEHPHIAARLDAYALRFSHGDADFLLLRRGGGYAPDIVKDAFNRHPYGLVANEMDLYLFQKNHDSPGTAAARAALGVL